MARLALLAPEKQLVNGFDFAPVERNVYSPGLHHIALRRSAICFVAGAIDILLRRSKNSRTFGFVEWNRSNYFDRW